MQFSINQRDLDKMIGRLGMFEKKIGKKVVRTAVRKSSNSIKDRIKFSAPAESGQLRRNLKVKVKTNNRTKTIYGIIGAKWLEDTNKNPAIYIHILEHGGKHKPAGTNPFAREAFDASRQQAAAIVVSELRTGFAKAAAGVM